MQKLLADSRVRIWLAIVGTATLVMAGSYSIVQQQNRLSANDLPQTVAQTIKDELASGAAPGDIVPALKTDLRTDSTVFAIITDGSRHILAGSATLDNQPPLPPAGVFNYTQSHGHDSFTWEPAAGVRMATQVVNYTSSGGGFIITGQSLKMAEDRVTTFTQLSLITWLAVVAWTSLTLLLPRRTSASSKK